MNNKNRRKIDFSSQGSLLSAHFRAMANPCSIYIEHGDAPDGWFNKIANTIAQEAWRIEEKYSRYLDNSVVTHINNSQGQAVEIDSETFNLLTLSDTLWQESNGKFDISSGVLRTLWNFDNQSSVPNKTIIQELLKYIGWNKVSFDQEKIILPKGMQIDFGGIGKEYATDRCADIGAQLTTNRLLVNLGGDIAVRGKEQSQQPWKISIESKNGNGEIWKNLDITSGAIATSGDVYKSFVLNGKRYGHIIDATTGYPVENSPRTVTVAAPNCTEAGILATLAILHGNKAESFLENNERPFWLQF